MSKLISSPAEVSSEPAAQPSSAPPGSRPPHHAGPSSLPDCVLPLAKVDIATTLDPDRATLDQPRSLDSWDHDMIDFLVQKAIETCMPHRPERPSPPGARQRSSKSKP
jgi:hypothetical protein